MLFLVGWENCSTIDEKRSIEWGNCSNIGEERSIE